MSYAKPERIEHKLGCIRKANSHIRRKKFLKKCIHRHDRQVHRLDIKKEDTSKEYGGHEY